MQRSPCPSWLEAVGRPRAGRRVGRFSPDEIDEPADTIGRDLLHVVSLVEHAVRRNLDVEVLKMGPFEEERVLV